jgi:phosphoribosylformylglycinamidine cyclo-ligase
MIGTIVGYVSNNEKMSPHTDISHGDYIVGFKSHGSHTNGYSLIRSILDKCERNSIPEDVIKELGHHHVCYYDVVKKLRENNISLHGMAHITGGGFYENIGRILPPNTTAHIETNTWDLPKCFEFLKLKGEISNEEMFSVFNCGIGFALFLSEDEYTKLKELKEQNKSNITDLDFIEIGRVCGEDKQYSLFSKKNKKERNVLNKESVYMYL